MIKQHRSHNACAVGLFCLFFLVYYLILNPSPAHPSPGIFDKTIFFYNTESNIDSFSAMKTTMDRYFKKVSNYTFQPFSDKIVFEKFITKRKRGIVILSSWHFQTLKKHLSLFPSHVGVLEGRNTQIRILVSKTNNSMKNHKNFSVASAGSWAYSESLVNEMFSNISLSPKSTIRILTVPKDIDALMAVGFNLAGAALTSRSCFNLLKTINPGLYAKLHKIATSPKALLPLVATIESEKMPMEAKSIFKQMPETEEGRKCLAIMGLDSWDTLTAGDMTLLEQYSIRN